MAQKQCGECGEMVDEAKAFCPGCGDAFVAEEGREATRFEKMDSTVQLGQTMYNQMLSDMGLSVEKGVPPEKRIEIVEPAAPAPAFPKKPGLPTPRSKSSRTAKWIIVAGIILVAGFIALLVAGLLLYYFWLRNN